MYGIKNTSEFPIEAVIDLSSSENTMYSSKGPLVKKISKPGELTFITHA